MKRTDRQNPIRIPGLASVAKATAVALMATMLASLLKETPKVVQVAQEKEKEEKKRSWSWPFGRRTVG